MALTRCAAAEAAPSGVRVNAVSPSLAEHPFLNRAIPDEDLAVLRRRELFGRGAETWEVANVIVFLASDYSSYLSGRGHLREQPAPVTAGASRTVGTGPVTGPGIGGAPADEEDPRADLIWGTIPGWWTTPPCATPGPRPLVDGDVRLTYAELAREVDRYARGFVAAGVGRGRPGGHVGAQLRRVDAGRAGRAAGRRGAGAAQHPLQGRRGRLHPARLRGHDAGHRPRLPGRRLPGHARGRGHRATCARSCCCATRVRGRPDGPGVRRRAGVDGAGGVPGGGDGVDPARDRRPGGGGRARRPVRSHLHLGHHGPPQGGGDHPRAVACAPSGPGPPSSGSAPATATWWSTRSSTPSATRPGILACLMAGATVVPEPVFDAAAVMERIAAERISVLPGPPTLYQTLLADPARAEHDLSSLRLGVTGAAVVPVELVQAMRDELGFDTVLTAYGLTESCGTVTMCRRSDPPEIIAPTSGRAIPGLEVRAVVDGARGGAGRAGRDRRPGLHRDVGLLGQRRGHGRDHRCRGLAAHRRHRRHGRGGQRDHHRPPEGHVRGRRLQRLPGRDRGHAARPRGRGPGRGRRRARRADGRGGLRLYRAGVGADGPATRRRRSGGRCSAGPATPWPTTKCPAGRAGRRAAGERQREGAEARAAPAPCRRRGPRVINES